MPGVDRLHSAILSLLPAWGSWAHSAVQGVIAVALVVSCTASLSLAQAVTPSLSHGAAELGLTGSMTTVEGITSGSLLADGTYFIRAAKGLVGLGAGFGFHNIEDLSETEIEGVINWQRRLKDTATYPYISVGGGLRHEEIGSFGQNRYPLGFGLGVRALLGQRGGFRVEYRFRRIFNDPSREFSEHRIMLGLAVYFRNPPVKRETNQ
jgi:hypothetical protein